jgi:hypothetical protein
MFHPLYLVNPEICEKGGGSDSSQAGSGVSRCAVLQESQSTGFNILGYVLEGAVGKSLFFQVCAHQLIHNLGAPFLQPEPEDDCNRSTKADTDTPRNGCQEEVDNGEIQVQL